MSLLARLQLCRAYIAEKLQVLAPAPQPLDLHSPPHTLCIRRVFMQCNSYAMQNDGRNLGAFMRTPARLRLIGGRACHFEMIYRGLDGDMQWRDAEAGGAANICRYNLR